MTCWTTRRTPGSSEVVRVPVVGLFGRTGERRPLIGEVDPTEFGDDPWGLADGVEGPVGLDLTLEAVSEGVLVRGEVSAALRIPCARCLAPTVHRRRAAVTELHRRVGRGPGPRGRAAAEDDDAEGPDEGEEYLLVDGGTALDLDRMVRDALLLDVPVRVLCRPDCAGLCPVCGRDRNTGPCDHPAAPTGDPRWAALDELRARLAAEGTAEGPADGPTGSGPHEPPPAG
jgi:uncharacterized protein